MSRKHNRDLHRAEFTEEAWKRRDRLCVRVASLCGAVMGASLIAYGAGANHDNEVAELSAEIVGVSAFATVMGAIGVASVNDHRKKRAETYVDTTFDTMTVQLMEQSDARPESVSLRSMDERYNEYFDQQEAE